MAKHVVEFDYIIGQRVLNIYNEKEGTVEQCILGRGGSKVYLIRFNLKEAYLMDKSQISEVPTLTKEDKKAIKKHFADKAECKIL